MKRTFVLGLDGVPYSLLSYLLQNNMNQLKNICKYGEYKRIQSVIPTISSVAWTSYATGKNPAEHGIFGFVDRHENPFQIFFPTSIDRHGEPLWTTLSKKGQRVIVVNVPLTYPPESINGQMVSGFLCSDIKKSSYPENLYKFLEEKGYIIDVDAWLARDSRGYFLDQLLIALEKRFEVSFELMEKGNWDFFQLHIMETDRLMHFFWEDINDVNSIFYEKINSFFQILDQWIGKLYSCLDDNDSFVIMSDHGFCGIKYEVQLNVWLKQRGFLKFDNESDTDLANYNEESICYSILPGRIFINLEGREEKGTVKLKNYNKIRNEIKYRLLNLKNPENNEKVIKQVFFREELYSGNYLDRAADIIANPVNGYDLKGSVKGNKIFTNSNLTGMHTYDDALLIGLGLDISQITSIQDIAGKILCNYL